MKIKDVKSAIGSLRLEGLVPSTEAVQHLYSLTDEYKELCQRVNQTAKERRLKHIPIKYVEYCEIIKVKHG